MAARLMSSAEYLRQCFDYNPETGSLTWRDRPLDHFPRPQDHAPWNERYVGHPAGTIRKTPLEYLYLRICGQNWLAHRIIYKMVTGKEPDDIIDHRDGDTLSNRWSNLREATDPENNRNQRKKRDTYFPLKGVVKSATKGRYQSRIYVDGRQIWLGTFPSVDAAHKAYCEAAKLHHGEFSRPG